MKRRTSRESWVTANHTNSSLYELRMMDLLSCDNGEKLNGLSCTVELLRDDLFCQMRKRVSYMNVERNF